MIHPVSQPAQPSQPRTSPVKFTASARDHFPSAAQRKGNDPAAQRRQRGQTNPATVATSKSSVRTRDQRSNFGGSVLGCSFAQKAVQFSAVPNQQFRITWWMFHNSTRTLCSCILNARMRSLFVREDTFLGLEKSRPRKVGGAAVQPRRGARPRSE